MTHETMRDKAISDAYKVPFDVAAYITHEINNSLQLLMGLPMLKRQDGGDHDKAIDIAMYAVDRVKNVVVDLFPEYQVKAIEQSPRSPGSGESVKLAERGTL